MYVKIFIVSFVFSILALPMAAQASDLRCDYYCEDECCEDYCEYYYYETVFVTTARLNMRSAPSVDGTIILTANAGRRVEVTDFRDGVWFAVYHNGQHGYMYAEFIDEVTISTRPTPVGTVELIEWSDARNIVPRNTPITIKDVRTGLTWQMITFSHGNHADAVTITPEDTATMLQAFGGRWTWAPRPILVITGDRTIAASINGMPHSVDGGIRNNNLNGHVCIHFLNSRTHNGNRNHERDHQNAVREAYNTASNW